MSSTRHFRAGQRQTLSDLKLRLRRQSYKVTGPRQAVLGLLRHHDHPLTIREIFQALGKDECDLATVYRSIRLMEKMGMVKRFDFGDGMARFELLDEGDDGHHHHLVCTRCAEIVELHECSMKELEQRITTRNGFKSVSHKLEFFGICPACQ